MACARHSRGPNLAGAQGVEEANGREGRRRREPRHVWNELLPPPLSSSLTRTKGCASSIFLAYFFLLAPSSISPLVLLPRGYGERVRARKIRRNSRVYYQPLPVTLSASIFLKCICHRALSSVPLFVQLHYPKEQTSYI